MSNIVTIPIIAHEIVNEMLQRLVWVKFDDELDQAPSAMVIASIGPYASIVSVMLKARYPHATCIAHVDADAVFKLSPQSFDLLFAVDILPWVDNLDDWLTASRICLKPNGLLACNAYGLETLSPWQAILASDQKIHLYDMHDIGDSLLQINFQDPVLDVQHYTFTYKEKATLFQDLLAQPFLQTTYSLSALQAMLSDYRINDDDGQWWLQVESIYIHAFAPQENRCFSANNDGEVRVPLSALKLR